MLSNVYMHDSILVAVGASKFQVFLSISRTFYYCIAGLGLAKGEMLW